MKDFFNSTMENLGDMLFGEDSTADDLLPYVAGLDDAQQDQFVEAVNEALLFEKND